MKKISVRFMAEGAVIAALYAVLTYVSAMLNIAYGPVQFRFSEALTVLPVFTPAAVPGLAIGCFLANLTSPLGIIDWVFGTGATLLAAVISLVLKDIKWKNIPILSILSPVIINALVIGTEIAFISESGNFLPQNFTAAGFAASALSVGAGELVVCLCLGIPLYLILIKIWSHIKQ